MANWIWLALMLYVLIGSVVFVVLRAKLQRGSAPFLSVIFFPLWLVFIFVAAIGVSIVGVFQEHR